MILWLHFSKSKTINFNVVYIQQFGVCLGRDLIKIKNKNK
jgi:hypothetical protein